MSTKLEKFRKKVDFPSNFHKNQLKKSCLLKLEVKLEKGIARLNDH